MEGRLYELIQDYLREHAAIRGAHERSFRFSSIRAYAAQFPSRYPEYAVDTGRLRVAVETARINGEIVPAISGARDELLRLRADNPTGGDMTPPT